MESRFRSEAFLFTVARYAPLVLIAVLAAAALISFWPNPSAVHAQQDQNEGQVISGPFVGTSVKFDVSAPLRSVKPIVATKFTKAEDDDGGPPPLAIVRHEPDPVVQTSTGIGVFNSEIPGPIVSFDGQSNPNACGTCAPPDPNGEIGPNHYIQMVNLKFQIFNRTGGSLFGPANTNTLFLGFGGPCETENPGDPVVLYDQLANRWLLSQFTDTAAPFFNCVAISQTSDPLGAYYRYAFPAMSFPDYPKYGVWPDAYYLNTRESGRGAIGNYALDRAAMLAGNPTITFVRFDVTEGGGLTGPNGLLPADLDGTILPLAGTPEFFLGSSDNDAGAAADALQLYKFHVDFVTPGNSTFGPPTVIPISPFDTIYGSCSGTRNCIPQPGTTQFVDILSYRQRPTFRLAYRKFADGHEALVTNQSVEASVSPLTAGIRWWEIRSPSTTPVLFQEGTYAPGITDNIHRWMGSIAMDKDGNMGLGYSVSAAATIFPGVRYTGRLAGDPLGTMAQGEGTIVDGTSSQTTINRWGDYSDMTVDPTDDCTFWYTQEYYATATGANWKTRIGSFKFPSCVQGTPTPSPTQTPGQTPTPTPTPTPIPTPTPTPTPCGTNYTQTTGTGATLVAGTTFLTGSNCDDCSNPITLPFTFRLYNQPFTTVNAVSNGNLQFSSADTEFDNTCLPYTVANNAILPHWDDLLLTGTGQGIYTSTTGTAPNRIFNIEWRGGYFSGGGTVDLEARLYETTNQIDFVYGTVTQTGTSATVGLQKDTGSVINQFSCDTSSLSSGFRVTYVPTTCGTPSPSPTPSPTPSPSPSGRTVFDFDGDHKTDISVWRASAGQWWLNRSTTGTLGISFGLPTDIPRAADYTGDGKADVAFFRPSTSEWFVLRSEDFTYYAFPWGATGDISVTGDFDGDGRADPAVYRPSVQTWFILRSSGGVLSVPFGLNGDIPVPADYDGDGKTDVAIYRPGPGQWWVLRSFDGTVFAATFGSSTDKPVQGDYTGDGKADLAFFRPSTGEWYIIRSENFSFYAFPWGASTDRVAPGDYDGDGKFDAAVFRPSDTVWYILKSSGGILSVQFGLTNDIPVPGQSVP